MTAGLTTTDAARLMEVIEDIYHWRARGDDMAPLLVEVKKLIA